MYLYLNVAKFLIIALQAYIVVIVDPSHDVILPLSRSQALDSEQESFDREMLVHGKSLSEAEFNRLMTQHRRNMADLENNYEGEKERQRKALEKKVR